MRIEIQRLGEQHSLAFWQCSRALPTLPQEMWFSSRKRSSPEKSEIHLKQSGGVQQEVLNNLACQTVSGCLQQAAGMCLGCLGTRAVLLTGQALLTC